MLPMAIAYGSLFAWDAQELNCYKDGFCQTLNVHADLVIVWFALQLSLMGSLILCLYRRDRQLCLEYQLDEVVKSGRFISFQSAVEREFPSFRSIRRNPHPFRKVGLLSIVTVLILAFSHATLLAISFHFGEGLCFLLAICISLWFGYDHCWAKVTAIFEDLYST